MSRVREFRQIDVFTDVAYRGNPLAVVLDGNDLDAEEMLRFANWTNLSETTFLLPPTDPAADYHVRIFTTAGELPFAGHPTLGSCHAWLEAGGQPRRDDVVVQQCAVGLVPVRVTRDAEHGDDGPSRLAFAAPALLREGPLDTDTLQAALDALGLTADDVVASAWIDNGPGWLGLLLSSAQQVLEVRCAPTELKIGIAGPHPAGHEADIEVRAFFPANGVVSEDPATGSLNASLAQWLIGTGHLPDRYTAAQGTVLGRAGRIVIERDQHGDVWVAGAAVTCISGAVRL